jgi:E3 ubiquitin-protein ligase SHPRH
MSKIWKKIEWWRIVLDECQEIKTATTMIAKTCEELDAVHRWMMSGTPLTSSIDDLHGELQFLQVRARLSSF